MQPIHELLSRIRWDTEFARGEFQIGYYDRVADRIVLVALHEVRFPEDANNLFELVDEEGEAHRIPFHRVREVHKNGEVIWKRPQLAETGPVTGGSMRGAGGTAGGGAGGAGGEGGEGGNT